MRRKSESAPLVCAIACLIATGTVLTFLRSEAATKVSRGTLTFAERVAYQRTIEDVYWRHRIWPKERLDPKPSLDAVMSQAQLEKKVEDYLRSTQALQDYWQRPITAEDLQAEMDRMAENTKQPEVLRELFGALGNDPFLIAECLARSVLSERPITSFAQEQRKDGIALWEVGANIRTRKIIQANATYMLPTISDATTRCIPDSWTDTSTPHAPPGRDGHTAVWTGSEMIVWGGETTGGRVSTGGRYSPATDSWTKTSNTNPPIGRSGHTAVWTGSEMIVWGGFDGTSDLNTGGRYNPSTDSWTDTSITNAPDAREAHTAVWIGIEMIVWGGFDGTSDLNTGGRYNPSTDAWTATSITNAPEAREGHTAVWTGGEMVVWGGFAETIGGLNTGGRYRPASNSWTTISTINAPDARWFHTAVWTGNEMIVWGGTPDGGPTFFDTGGRYDVGSDSWTATTTTNAPEGRDNHTAIWTGNEMIVWGGYNGLGLNTGGRYNLGSDSWTATSTTDAPTPRFSHTAVWTGNEMIVWGGFNGQQDLNTGGRYCSQSGAPMPRPRSTPGVRPTPPPHLTPVPPPPSPRPTAWPRPTSPPHVTPVPTPSSPRPTPVPRP